MTETTTETTTDTITYLQRMVLREMCQCITLSEIALGCDADQLDMGDVYETARWCAYRGNAPLAAAIKVARQVAISKMPQELLQRAIGSGVITLLQDR